MGLVGWWGLLGLGGVTPEGAGEGGQAGGAGMVAGFQGADGSHPTANPRTPPSATSDDVAAAGNEYEDGRQSNSPLRTPWRKASHSLAVKISDGPSGSLE